MPIAIAPQNTNLKIMKILADEKTRKHLESLGIIQDSEIVVLSSNGGSVICVVKNTRIALDRSLSTKILVA